MKKLLFAVSALAALSLLAPSTGFAQHESSSNNQVGLFTNPNGTGVTNSNDLAVPVNVYLVLINPTDALNGETPYANLNAFELSLNFSGPQLFKLGSVLPPTAINVGDDSDIANGFLEYAVGIGTPVLITDGAALLISFQFMSTNPGTSEISLNPINLASIPGEMAFQSQDGQLRVMNHAGGVAGAIAFSFHGLTDPVAIENESFGGVKALFR